MSNPVNSGPYVDINDPGMYADSYVDINDPHIYFENARGVPPHDLLVNPEASLEQNGSLLSMRRLVGLVASHYTDRHVDKALVHEVKSSVLQAGLDPRVRKIWDNALELRRHMESMGRDELSAQFAEVVDRFQALPEAHQRAPLAILLTRCRQEKLLLNPRQLCTLATLIASRSCEEVEKLAQELHMLVCAHGVSARTAFVWNFLSVALDVGNKSEPTNGSDYAATFLRVLAIVTREFQQNPGAMEGDPPDHFDGLQSMRVLKVMRGLPNTKLEVLALLLTVSRESSDRRYAGAFEILKVLPLEKHGPQRELVFKAIFRRIGECEATLRSKVVNAYIQLISPLHLKDRERSLHLMFVAESAWTYRELTDKFFDALRQLDPAFEDMIERAIFRVPNPTRARLLLEAFVRYIRQEPIHTQKAMLTDLLSRVKKVLQHSKNPNIDEHCATALQKGLEALKS